MSLVPYQLYKTAKARVPKFELQNMERLLPYLEHPEKKNRFIHIAGSNGKGTVAWKIASALDVKVGLFTSPHISSFRERIRINRELIPEDQMNKLLNQIFQIIDEHELQATFFEITTCLGLLYFAQEQVDVVVLETGLGGRFDATNVVHPMLSIITSISLEHTDILGDTVEKICYEKAGIIKSHTPVIIGHTVPIEVIEPITNELECELLTASDNTAIAKLALERLPFPYQEEKLNVLPPCRFEEIGNVILDVAHNPEACRHLLAQVKQKYPDKQIYCLFGYSKKDTLESILKILKNEVQKFFMIDVSNGRALSAQFIHQKAQELNCDSQWYPTIEAAYIKAIQEDGILLVCGSFYILSDIRKLLGMNDVCD